MADSPKTPQDEKAIKRRKQLKRMTKIVAKAWALSNSEPFQESPHHRSSKHPQQQGGSNSKAACYDLTTIGQHIDKEEYGFGRHGWEQFAKDLGGVYNRHITRRNSKHAKVASQHMEAVKQMLGKLDAALVTAASDYCPPPAQDHTTTGDKNSKSKKRKSDNDTTHNKDHPKGKKRATHTNGSRKASPTPRSSTSSGSSRPLRQKKPMTTRECETEMRKVRRELDKLLKNHRKATKALDDFQNERHESQYPVDDEVLMEEEGAAAAITTASAITPTTCPAARIPDVDGFPGIPPHCVPDMIMVWDFLCTFTRALSLLPISLDNFAAALTYKPNTKKGTEGEHAPPVFLAEAHLGLLKLLLNDPASDDWWWSTLETDATEGLGGGVEEGDLAATAGITKVASDAPVIKVDMAALFAQVEDPLITTSWVQALENIRNAAGSGQIRNVVKGAMSIVTNPYVRAYLKISIRKGKGNSAGFTKRAVLWLVDRVRDARPDLWERTVNKQAMFKQRAKIVEECQKAMEKLDATTETVHVEEGVESDDEDSDDDSDEDSDDEGEQPSKNSKNDTAMDMEEQQDESNMPVKSVIPIKPPPQIVDLLLPPAKPLTSSGIVTSFSWPFLAGAAACRIQHWYKRLRNEVDDSVRLFHQLSPMSIAERRSREAVAIERTLSECVVRDDNGNPLERAIQHLSTGKAYLDLSAVERLCLLKILIDSAYDATKTYAVVDENFKMRISALKSLEAEERRAKREAREEAAAEAKTAREQLALDAKTNFLEEKRQQILELNKEMNEYSNEFIEGLTDEDIAEFDEETKNEYEALPKPENFNKTEVNKMVVKLQEAAAFGTYNVVVLSMDEIVAREKESLASMEKSLAEQGDTEALIQNAFIDRETSKRIEKLKKDIENAKYLEVSLPPARETALETLKDAMEDGTIKVLRGAIRVAKQVKLTGYDEETGGVFALDLLRDAHLELRLAEKRKRVIDAQKDLVAKRNKCFLRTEPMGRDRFRNRFWQFDTEEGPRIWVEADYVLNGTPPPADSNYINLLRDASFTALGEPDMEEDFVANSEDKDKFLKFCRQEYHSAGEVASLARRHWGCQTTEKSIRAMIKNVDRRGTREAELRSNLKTTLENSGLSTSTQPSKEAEEGPASQEKKATGDDKTDEVGEDAFRTKGDEDVFAQAKSTFDTSGSSVVDPFLLGEMESAIGRRVRVREVLEPSKIPIVANYTVATITGWKMQKEEVPMASGLSGSNVEGETQAATQTGESETPHDQQMSTVEIPVWRVTQDNGGEVELGANEILDSLCRYIQWKNQKSEYVEDDADFLSYRNSLGRHCGRAADAAMSSSPMSLARLMVKREQELYAPLKNRTYDNNWGGKSGARNIWITTMKDFAPELETVRNGLLTLEGAFLELTGGFANVETTDPSQTETPNGKALLESETARFDIELENIDKQVRGLWNSRQSREVFIEIVNSSTTTGFLSLALDLLCRNCWAYVDANKLSQSSRSSRSASNNAANIEAAVPSRQTRRMNAWQQANMDSPDNWYY